MPAPQNEENWVDVARVTEYLSYKDPESVYRLIQKGLPAVRCGMHWRFRLSEIDEWLRSGAAASPPRRRSSRGKNSPRRAGNATSG